mgnify:CR=1 FL=1
MCTRVDMCLNKHFSVIIFLLTPFKKFLDPCLCIKYSSVLWLIFLCYLNCDWHLFLLLLHQISCDCCFLFCNVSFRVIFSLFAGTVPRMLWITVGGAIFLGVYDKAKLVLSYTLLHENGWYQTLFLEWKFLALIKLLMWLYIKNIFKMFIINDLNNETKNWFKTEYTCTLHTHCMQEILSSVFY